jgi:hypothetical protein
MRLDGAGKNEGKGLSRDGRVIGHGSGLLHGASAIPLAGRSWGLRSKEKKQRPQSRTARQSNTKASAMFLRVAAENRRTHFPISAFSKRHSCHGECPPAFETINAPEIRISISIHLGG